jgi:hypothetical protein
MRFIRELGRRRWYVLNFTTEDYEPKKVRVKQVNSDGQTLKVMDIRAKRMLDKCMFPGELTVGTARRSEADPVIRLLKQLKIDAQPFIDPNLRVMPSEAEDFRLPPSRLDNLETQRRSATPLFPRPARPDMREGMRAPTPFQAAQGPYPARGEQAPPAGQAFGPFLPLFRGNKTSPEPFSRPNEKKGERNSRTEDGAVSVSGQGS